MKRIKEYNHIIKDESDKIIIRSIKNIDLTFYKNWYKSGHILKDAVNTVSEEDIEKWILHDTKNKYTLIIEINNIPYGEIVLWNDPTLKFIDTAYKKPYCNIMMKYYENINNNDINEILKLFLTSFNQLKIGLFYILIDEKEENNYYVNYLENGFKNLNKDMFKTRLEKYFEKNKIENPYNKLRMLVKNV